MGIRPKVTKEQPSRKIKSTGTETRESNDDSVIVWSFEHIDRNGKFAFDIPRKDFKLEEFLEKLLEFSTMKWCELFPPDSRKSRHHPISRTSISQEAEERIQFMQLEEETDSLFSLALNGKTRLIGIRKGIVFQVIWYDSNHEFAPSKKKHT